jgi:membrane associated rhomboid family serine protease
MNRTFSDGARRHFIESYQPLTNVLIAASIAIFLCDFARLPLSDYLDAVVPNAWMQPWRILTYPLLMGGNIIALIFSGLMIYFVGGSLEKSWGTKTFGIFYVAVSVVTALAFTVLALTVGRIGMIEVPGNLVLAALLVGFCTINPDETINLYGIIPIKTRYIAAGICIVIFFSLGFGNPFIGLMALVGCGFAVLWVKQDWAYAVGGGNWPASAPKIPKRPNLRLVDTKSRPRDDRFTAKDLNPLRWLARRNERKKFEKLMKDD